MCLSKAGGQLSPAFERAADYLHSYFLAGLLALPLPLGFPVVDGYIGPGQLPFDIIFMCLFAHTA